jgi:hypothetical protein
MKGMRHSQIHSPTLNQTSEEKYPNLVILSVQLTQSNSIFQRPTKGSINRAAGRWIRFCNMLQSNHWADGCWESPALHY